VLPALLLALALSAPPGKTSPAPAKAPAPAGKATTPDDRRAEVAKAVLQEAARIQRDVEAGDLSALLARVPPEGIRCGEATIPRSRVEKDLRTEASWLHSVLLGGPGAPAPQGQPASLRAFFARAKEVQVTVGFREDPGSELGLPCLQFHARDLAAPGAELCLERREGRWYFVESPYPC
jgi:hypothetical protein